MKRIRIFVLFTIFTACDDGNLQIESVNFDAVGLDLCVTDNDAKLTNTFFFKIQDDEALLLTMGSGQFINSTSDDGSLTSTLSATAAPTLIYRLFNGTVTKKYFCDAIPATEPVVVQASTATGGSVLVTTAVSTVDKNSKTYKHSIEITNLSLTNEQGERLTDTSTLDYGNFTTTTPISAGLVDPFSNYTPLSVSACEIPPATNASRLYKLLNDEFITLDIPNALLANVATGANPRIGNLGTDILFSNKVLNNLATKDLLCAATVDNAILVGNFISSGGQISISTIENAPNSDGKVSYTHTIMLTEVILVLKDKADSTKDVTLGVVPNIDFGSITTLVP